MRYLLKFAGGKEIRVDEEDAQKIDALWSKGEKNSKQIVKLPDGSSIRLSTLLALEPIREHREASDLTAVQNMAKIVNYLDTPTKLNYPNARKAMIEAYMKGKNHQRKRMGKPLLSKREMLKELHLNNNLEKIAI